MAKKLGIDLGSASLGWFIREDDEIINNGVVTFSTGMKLGKSGGYSSPTKDRREARSKRRLIQARKYRKWELLEILVEYDYVPLKTEELENWSKYKKGQQRKFPETDIFKKWLACDFTYENGIKYKNPYELRVKAIDNKLSKHEFGRALYHLVQRRGYKDIGETDKETKKQIERRGESGLQAAMETNRTIAEALTNDFLKKGERARNEYPYRDEYEEEFKTICNGQGFDISKNNKNEYQNEFVRKLRKAIIWQRPLRSQKGNIGKCSLETSKNRCPASHPIFEIFRAWSYINTIRYIDAENNKQEIPLEYRKDLFENKFLKESKNFKFDKIQKHLDKLFKEKKTYNYLNKRTKKYDSTVSGMPVCKGLVSIFGDKVKTELEQLHTYDITTKEHKIYNNYSVYDLWHLIAETDDDHIKDFAENKLGVETITKTNKKGEEYKENEIVKLKNSSFSSGYADLSLKAMCKIIPFLKEGFLYNEAVLLAKIPDVYQDWENNKKQIYSLIENANKKYVYNKKIIGIANNLINKYKGLGYNEELKVSEIFAHKDYDYRLDESDFKEIEKTCITTFGEKTWQAKEDKKEIIEQVSEYYQSFFADEKRKYIELPTLTKLIEKEFSDNEIEIDGEKLYHHSARKNLYPKPILNKKDGKELLAVPLIDSIKNPMFNKTMSVLRKLINELIVQKHIDKDTEIIVEVARELNDNNKRKAIERYQKERESNREKYSEFIREFTGKKEKDADIKKFEMWNEQIFEEAFDDSGNKITNKNPNEIRKEKKVAKRYELWKEQKGQCMYTGKMISISQLFSGEIQEEHTIPRSLLPDNTMANLTVCYSKYNSDIKNNRLPTACPNYEIDTTEGTAIEPRLEKWKKIRDKWKFLFESRLKPKFGEDETAKSKRIQERHYFKMHLDYWKDKVNRFTAEEIKDSWVRRQLTDTQMVSKYAREFLKTHFKKVAVQKGNTTSDYRKIFGFQEKKDKKDRTKHTHHSIDAAVLTLIPTNSSKRIDILNKMYRLAETQGRQYRTNPDGFYNFNAQKLVNDINNNTLIVNYHKDKIIEQTYRYVRKRGKLQYLKDKNGKFKLDKDGEKILLKAQGATIRGKLFQETFIGKIKNVERDKSNKPLRNKDGSWQFKTGKDEFLTVVRKPIMSAKIENIIDPNLKELIQEQLKSGVSKSELKDFQGNTIRRVRVTTNAGRVVKERVNYKSKHDYKNKYYSAAGEIPYAIFITNLVKGGTERKMIPITMHEVAQTYKEYHKFTIEFYMEKSHPKIKEYQDIKLLKVGQKVFVLKDDNDFEKRKDKKFQINRLYKITQFEKDSIIWLHYHIDAQSKGEIKKNVKSIKDKIVETYEKKYSIPLILENNNIKDMVKRKNDLIKRKHDFKTRLAKIQEKTDKETANYIKTKIEKYKAQPSYIEIEGETPILGLTKKNWNFLFEHSDFEIDITGKLSWIEK